MQVKELLDFTLFLEAKALQKGVETSETFYYLPESGFGKPQRAQRTQRKQQLSVPSVSSVVNLLRHNQSPPGKIKKSQTAIASETSLMTDWLRPEEDEAWQDL